MPARHLLLGAVLLRGAASLDNGLALTPPMGWRSWNCYGGDVSASKIMATIDAVASRARSVAGVPTSLADLGYQHVGVDDGWQACQTGKDCSFHAANGAPLVNKTSFPNLRALVQYGEAKQVLVGWYQINCICCDEFTDTGNATWKHAVYAADAAQLRDAGFHGVKLDDCGDASGAGLLERAAAINASGHALLIENSNQGVGGPAPAQARNGRDNPASADAPCPFHMFRTGGDITPDFGVVIDKLQRTVPYLGNDTFKPISRPGCWAYVRRRLGPPPPPPQSRKARLGLLASARPPRPRPPSYPFPLHGPVPSPSPSTPPAARHARGRQLRVVAGGAGVC